VNPLIWLLGGAFGLFALEKKARAGSLLDQGGGGIPPGSYGEKPVATPFPAGYRRLKSSEVTPDLLAKANAVRNSPGFTSAPYGTIIDEGDGNAVLVEQHYHEPGGPVKPWGYHHGATLITRI